MSIYRKIDAQPIAVGVINAPIVAPFNAGGERQVLYVVQNISLTETFTGIVSSSPNGVTQWTDELSDEFASIAPGITRRLLLPLDRIWSRLNGNFLGAPASVRVSVILLPPIPFR